MFVALFVFFNALLSVLLLLAPLRDGFSLLPPGLPFDGRLLVFFLYAPRVCPRPVCLPPGAPCSPDVVWLDVFFLLLLLFFVVYAFSLASSSPHSCSFPCVRAPAPRALTRRHGRVQVGVGAVRVWVWVLVCVCVCALCVCVRVCACVVGVVCALRVRVASVRCVCVCVCVCVCCMCCVCVCVCVACMCVCVRVCVIKVCVCVYVC